MSLMFYQKVSAAWKQAKEAWKKEPINTTDFAPDWQEDMNTMRGPASQMRQSEAPFDPEEFSRKILTADENSKSIPWLMKEVEAGRAVIDRGWVFEARTNSMGKMIKECLPGQRRPFKLTPIKGHLQFLEAVERSKRHERLMENGFGSDLNQSLFGPFDPNQYTEYAPLMGGYFFAQQYLTDMLKGFAYAFEAWNHNPLAHRIINALAQYTLGRRFTWQIDDQKKQDVWEAHAEKIQLRQRMSKYWIREKLIFGEQLIDTKKWRTIHPATCWDIITDPDDFNDVYYYYRSYPTAYQMFSGYKVAGVPGADKVEAQRYVIEQVPYSQIIHTKSQCTSFEKRGRSTLFPILGWLKRMKDIYNNQAVREQMLADYVWDVEIDGGPGDVSKYASQYSHLTQPGSTHFHNKAVKRTPMSMPAGGGGHSEASNNILSFIATAIGMPKDFFNIISTSGGNRATALVAAEPFTKVIEDEQADQEHYLHRMAKEVFEQAGLDYHPNDIEFTFPSVVKDTTSEMIKNITIGESLGYISKERAATMFSQELNITSYDFELEQTDIKDEQAKGISGVGMPPPGQGKFGPDGQVSDDETPIAGSGKVDTMNQMNNL